jgi:hypothetical protein
MKKPGGETKKKTGETERERSPKTGGRRITQGTGSREEKKKGGEASNQKPKKSRRNRGANKGNSKKQRG